MGIEKLLTDTLRVDSVDYLVNNYNILPVVSEKSILDSIYSISTLVIALVNVFLIIFIFLRNNKKDASIVEKNRKINLLKTLILDCNMNKYYSFYMKICRTAKKLKREGLNLSEKELINEQIADYAVELREGFTDLFIAIDKKLYDDILKRTDELIDCLTDKIFDEGINLSHGPKFDEEISTEIRNSKTDILELLFSYSGE